MYSVQAIVSRLFCGLGILLLLIATGCGGKPTSGTNPSSPGPAASGEGLVGGGSTFVAPMMNKWKVEYGKAKKVTIDYTKSGSGQGIQKMIDGNLDFGCTDAPMNDKELKTAEEKNGKVLHIPLVAGGVVPIYNIPEIKEPLKFTGELLAEIYLEKISSWDDPKIKELNPDAKLPALKIATVHRSQSSGTTYIFTDFLFKTSKNWAEAYPEGGKKEISWKGGGGEGGNPEIAAFVQKTLGAIGYVELDYAIGSKLPYGSVRNKAGKDVLATPESVTAALDSLQEIPASLTFNLNDQPGEKTYPICGCVWAVLYAKQPSKGKALSDFFLWAVTDGQTFADSLSYAKLPQRLVDKIKPELETLK